MPNHWSRSLANRLATLSLTLVTLLGVLSALPAWAYSSKEIGAPPSLEVWKDWVLFQNYPEAYCPRYHRSPISCQWASGLTLNLTETNGSFTGTFVVFAPLTIRLPGGPKAWPSAVTDSLNGQPPVPLPVVNEDGPRVYLTPGRHVIKGQWAWPKPPDTLTLPLVHLVTVTLNGQEVLFPYQEINFVNETIFFWLKDPQSPSLAPPPPNPNDQAANLDELKVTLDRLIMDDQPMRVTTRVKLTVSGREREETLKSLLLPGSIPTVLRSPLPVRLIDEGLRVRVKPGIYEILVTARLAGETTDLGPVSDLYGSENWAVLLDPALRQAEISGAPQIDASQTDLPWRRRNLPIYVLAPGQSLTFKTLRRGDPDPGPDQLALERSCWLDYNGQGLSCRDHLSGVMRGGWKLSADPPFVLGQASVNDQPQVLTYEVNSKGQKTPGLELRRGQFNLTADLRLNDFQGVLPASGWDHNLVSSAQILHLPPGYQLGSVSGARATNSKGQPISWFDRWNTLDLFVVLAIFLAALKTKGKLFALLALGALVLSYHEFMSPRVVILHVLGALALLKVLPSFGVARGLVKVWLGLALMFLALVSVVFVIHQARIAMYPQLENPHAYVPGAFGYPMSEAFYKRSEAVRYQSQEFGSGSAFDLEDSYSEPLVESPAESLAEVEERPSSAPKLSRKQSAGKADNLARSVAPSPNGSALNQASMATPNPEAIVQNSLARPDWQWLPIYLDFNGQVARDQEVKIYLLGPTVRRLLFILRIALLVALVLKLVSWSFKAGFKPGAPNPTSDPDNGPALEPTPDPEPASSSSASSSPASSSSASSATTLAGPIPALALLLALVLGVVFSWAEPLTAQSITPQTFPSEALLNEYLTRLTLPDPRNLTPGIPKVTIEAKRHTLKMTFEVEAVGEAVLGLPSLDASFFQARAINLASGEGLPVILQSGPRAFVLVPAGLNSFVYEGRVKPTELLQIRFPEEFRPQRVFFSGDGWVISGVDKDGFLESETIHLINVSALPLDKGAPDPEAVEPEPKEGSEAAPDIAPEMGLKPFFKVNRVLALGLEWRVITTINLDEPMKYPVALRLPLIPGEKPISSKYQIQKGQILIDFPPSQTSAAFESTLTVGQESLVLTAGQGPYNETWFLDASTLWRVEPTGLTPILNLSPQGFWNPQWRPWPGESLTLKIVKPEPVPGVYLVADEADLKVVLGQRNRRFELTLALRSSRGGVHAFRLPKLAEIQTLTLNGRNLAFSPDLSSEGPLVTIPLQPGNLSLNLTWLSPEPLTAKFVTPPLDLGLPTANVNIKVAVPEDRLVFLAGGPVQGPAVLFWSMAGALLVLSYALGRTKITPLKATSWFLLFVGLSHLSLLQAAFPVAAWLLVLGLRGRGGFKTPGLFNLSQIILVVWTILALDAIYRGLKRALLEAPAMRVTGNGSNATNLNWFQDQAAGSWPEAWAYTLSDTVYHYIMLAWALWLAIALIRWLIWGYKAFATNGLWKKFPKKEKKPVRSAARRPLSAKDVLSVGPPIEAPPEEPSSPDEPSGPKGPNQSGSPTA